MKITIFILTIEICALLFCFGFMIFVRCYRNWQYRQTIQRRAALQQMFVQAIQKKQILSIDRINRRLRHYDDLLATVENFDRWFLDTTWQETKKLLIKGYLGKKALTLARSCWWTKRQLGLRCIALDPKQLMNKQVVAPLLNDSKYLVRILAAAAMVQSEQKDLLLAVLKRMVQEPTMGRYAYRDFLINSGETNFRWIEEIANEEKDQGIIAICLEVLSSKTSHNLLPLAAKHINSPNLACRLAAMKIFSSIPGQESKEYLTRCLFDGNEEIRAEAARGLGQILAISSIPELTLTLRDPIWFVRLQAAIALKAMGKEGREALYRQNPQQNVEASDIAKYILNLP